MKIEVLTLFPGFVEQVVTVGMPRKAVECGALQLQVRDLRDWSDGADRRVDDRPYGGGPGMVMEAEPLARAIDVARLAVGAAALVIAPSPQGEPMTQALLQALSAKPGLVLVCGRYEGLDERIASRIDLEVSLGDFVLSGGDLAAMVLIDGIARLLPGVLGHEGSAAADSFSAGLLDHPHYTRPPRWRGIPVPEVLLSGDHAKIARWRLKQALGATFLKRPDLIEKLSLSGTDAELLREFLSERSGEKNQTST